MSSNVISRIKNQPCCISSGCQITSWCHRKRNCISRIHIFVCGNPSYIKGSIGINLFPGKGKSRTSYIYNIKLLGINHVVVVNSAKADTWCVAGKVIIKRIGLRCRRIRGWSRWIGSRWIRSRFRIRIIVLKILPIILKKIFSIFCIDL